MRLSIKMKSLFPGENSGKILAFSAYGDQKVLEEIIRALQDDYIMVSVFMQEDQSKPSA